MTIPADDVTPVPDETAPPNVILVGGPLAGREVSMPDPGRPYIAADNDGTSQEYRPDGTTAYSRGQNTGLPVLRHFGPLEGDR